MSDYKPCEIQDQDDANKELIITACGLRCLASSFANTGNLIVADRLIEYARNIDLARDVLEAAYIEAIQAHGNFAREMTGGILTSLLNQSIRSEPRTLGTQ